MRHTASVAWDVILLSEVTDWYESLDDETADLVTAAIDLLTEVGPTLGRPLVDTLQGTRLNRLKELRPGSVGRSEVRILFVFDPLRQAVLPTAGDKAGRWRAWYTANILLAEARYARWLAGDYDEENS